jgi:methionine-rich copper-binding protein CopC
MRGRLTMIPFLLLAAGAGAQAHAMLDHASPLVGSTIAAAPREVSLSFSQGIDQASSGVEVSNTAGARVDQGKPQISGSTMRVPLKPLSPGTYRVHWYAVSADSHKSEGNFVFHVGKP